MSVDTSLGADSTVDVAATSEASPASFSSLLDAYDAVLMESSDEDSGQQSDGTGLDNDIVEDGVGPDEGDYETVESNGWDWREYASKPVTVKINGEETEVPLEELRNGYMRQQDYTFKTQQVAEERKLAEWAKEFQARFSEDPKQMVRMLASAVGAQLDGGTEQAEPDPFADLLASDPELAPVANTIKQQNQMIQALHQELSALKGEFGRTVQETESERNLRLVKEEISEMKGKFEDFDEMQVLQVAAKTGLDLESSYLLLKGAEWQKSKSDPVGQQTEKPQAAPQRPVNPEKKKVAQTVTNSRFAGTPSTDGDQYSTFAELFDIVARTEGAG